MKILPIVFSVVAALSAGTAAAQIATHATSRCPIIGGPSLGIGTYHCQGGECIVKGMFARIVPPGSTRSGGSGGTDSRDAWQFTVEPSLWEINPNGPAAGRLFDGDVLVAVNGAPITTREASGYLRAMEPRNPLTLTVRRGGRLVRTEIRPSRTCEPVTVSAGVADRPSFLIRDELGRLPR